MIESDRSTSSGRHSPDSGVIPGCSYPFVPGCSGCFVSGRSSSGHFVSGHSSSDHFAPGCSGSFVSGHSSSDHFVSGRSSSDHFVPGCSGQFVSGRTAFLTYLWPHLGFFPLYLSTMLMYWERVTGRYHKCTTRGWYTCGI